MKNLKKIVTIMICILLLLATVNIAFAQVDASGQTAVSMQSDDLRLPLSPGTTLAGENTAGNMGSSIAQAKEDSTTAPITIITMPANNAHIYNTYTVTGTVSDEKISSWELYYGAGSSPASWKRINSGTGSVVNGTLGTWYIGSFKDGSVYTLKLVAANSAGKTSKTTSTITIDSTVAPYTDMFVPNNVSYINGTVTITGTAYDTDLNGWKLDYGLGEVPKNWTVMATGTTPVKAEVLYQWDTSSLKDGNVYTIRLGATDQNGNYIQTTKHLKKEASMPAASISLPANHAHISGTYTVTGAVSGTKLDYWELDYGAGSDPSSWTEINTGKTPVTNGTLGTWNTSSLINGSVYTLQLTAADLAGHRIQSVSQVTIDSASNPTSTSTANPAAAPITTIASPANNSNVKGNETVTGTVSDTKMGRWVLEFGAGASPATWTEINSGLASVASGTLGSWDTSTLAAGIYTVRLREVDIGGNTHQTAVQVTVGSPAANLSISTPENNPNASGAVPAAGTATGENNSNLFSESIKGFFNGLSSFFQQAYKWITGK